MGAEAAGGAAHASERACPRAAELRLLRDG